MTIAEGIALAGVASQLIPMFVALFNQKAAASGGAIRPLADILKESDTNFDAVIAAAKKELGMP